MSASLAIGDFSPAPAPVPRLAVAVEMLAALDTLTMAGQQHMMGRITGLLAAEAQRRRHQSFFSLDSLTREVRRMAPDVAAFKRQAEPILAALGARLI